MFALAAQTRDWLLQFLDKRGFAEPTGQPLYSYRCSRSELAELRELLKKSPLDEVELLPRAAAFTMFAAEQFRIAPRDGAWAWRTVLNPLGQTGSNAFCRVLVADGLKYWKRPLRMWLDGSRDFLFSIVLEGGFPSDLLTKNGNHLASWLESLQSQAALFNLDSDDLTLAAEETAGKLPQSLQRKELYTLASDLVAAVRELRRQVGAFPDDVEPLLLLEEKAAGWRTRLPLELEDEPARALIWGLMRAKPELPTGSAGFFDRLLQRTDDGWTPVLRVKDQCPFDEKRLVEGARDLLHGGVIRARLLAEDALARAHDDELGFIERRGEDWMFRRRHRTERPIPFALDKAVTCAVAVDGRVSPPFVAPGGAPVLDGVLVFSKLDEATMAFFGNGARSTRTPEIFAAWDPGEATYASDPGAVVTDFGPVVGSSFRLFSVSGRIKLKLEDEFVTTLAAGQERESGRAVMMMARPAPGCGPEPASIGMPQLAYVHGLKVAKDKVRWRPVSAAGPWRSLDSGDPRGHVQIVVSDQEGVVDRLRVTVMPSDFKVTRSNVTETGGTIHLHGLGSARVAIEARQEIDVSVDQDDVSIDLTVTADAAAATAEFQVSVAFAGGGRAEIYLPVPRRGVAFVDADGRRMPRGATRRVGDLAGVRARGDDGELLVATLRDWGTAPDRQPVIRRLTDGQSLAASSADFQSLLAETADLDAIIVVEAAHARIELMRFAAKFDVSAGSLVPPTTTEGLASSEPVVIQSFDLQEAHLGPTLWSGALEHAADQAIVSPDDAKPWLIWMEAHDRAITRPQLLPAREPQASDDQFVAASYLPNRNARFAAMTTHLREMTTVPMSPDWGRLHRLVADVSGRVPLPAFDWLVALSREPEALAAFVAHGASQQSMLRAFDIEDELAFLWETIPVSAWLTTFSGITDRLREQLTDAPELARQLAQGRVKNLAEARPTLAPIAFAAALATGLSPPDLLTPANLQDLMQGFVLRNDNRQPPDLSAIEAAKTVDPTVSRYAPIWHGCLSAPWSAAEICSEIRPATPAAEAAIRTARRFDPGYFNSAFAVALRSIMLSARKA